MAECVACNGSGLAHSRPVLPTPECEACSGRGSYPDFKETKACQCPVCGAWCEARPAFLQATRREPMRFLGWQAYCMADCRNPPMGGMAFTPEVLQEAMPV